MFITSNNNFLKKFESSSGLLEVLELTQNQVHLIQTYNAIKIQVLMKFSECERHVFLHENSSGAKLWIVIFINDYAPPNLIFDCHPKDVFQKEELWKALDEIIKEFPRLYEGEIGPMFMGHQQIFKMYEEWLHLHHPKVTLVGVADPVYSLYLYYMTDDQADAVKKLSINLSKNYSFSQVDLKNDPKLIADNWNYAVGYRDVVNHMEAQLRDLPYSFIREKSTNDLVAFGLVHQTGVQYHRFCFPEHRLQGLGKAIELDRAKKCVEFGIVPYKTVGFHNTSVKNSSDQSPFWTRWEVDGEPVEMRYIIHSSTKSNV